MFALPRTAEPLLLTLGRGFTRPTFDRFLALLVGYLFAADRHALSDAQWAVRGLVPGHFTSFHRVFSRARWSLWPMSRTLAQHVLRLVPADEPVLVAMDDTVTRHAGPRIYGRGCHRDAVRSSHAITSVCWGHRWVVLAVLVRLPLISRPWALPVLCALYRPREVAEKEGRRFKTPCHLAAQLAGVLMRWFPERKFIFLGDGGFASFDLAKSIHRRGGGRGTLVARFYDDASIYEPAPPWPPRKPGRKGRKPIKGPALPRPKQATAGKTGRRTTIAWYGGRSRRVELLDDQGMWYRSGRGVVPVRWVLVRDRQGTHRAEYLFSTDQSMSPEQIAEAYTGRWSIETTFQECNRHLGLQAPRCRVKDAVLRLTPCLLGLFSLVALIYAEHVRRTGMKPARVIASARPWYSKAEPTFIDALALVRRLLGERLVETPPLIEALQKIPPVLRTYITARLRCAARPS